MSSRELIRNHRRAWRTLGDRVLDRSVCRTGLLRAILAVTFVVPVPLMAATSTLLGWNNLGMHCMDSDYSVFSILPPYNAFKKNSYPLMRMTAYSGGAPIATSDVVLPVSDEMDCRLCHGSGTDTFTFAAFDGSKNSTLATVTVVVTQATI